MGFKEISYEDRLREWNLLSLLQREMRVDLTEVFKVLKGADKVNPSLYFKLRKHRKEEQLELEM